MSFWTTCFIDTEIKLSSNFGWIIVLTSVLMCFSLVELMSIVKLHNLDPFILFQMQFWFVLTMF